eukprot:CAMPEP_0171457476 /NCGR_PEP_ID=MMETSP0945-20130129/3547_1 /TAXON_ID=109269 /ORGANISM="Vaucheria litorea, Strain CCMP2940" /LENGTH=205 /DNA_ID=CAMNT_0011983107 /DNA_START=93 /DNA_END=707 /DNA_ORIENTATION=+
MGLCVGKLDIGRIIVIGLDGAGKTTLLYQAKSEPTANTIPTIGFNVEAINIEGFGMLMWDLGGQSNLRSLWSHYMKDTNGIVFVVDAADPERFSEAKKELENALNMQDLTGCRSFLILANKQDIPGAVSAEQLAKTMDLENLFASKTDEFSMEEISALPTPIEKNESPKFERKFVRSFEPGAFCSWTVQPCCALTGKGIKEGLSW